MTTAEPEPLRCEWPIDQPCDDEVVAKVGLPAASAIFVCRRHFDEWKGLQRGSGGKRDRRT